MFLIIIGIIIGAIIGSLPGALVGGLIGYGASVVLRQSVVGGLRVVQSRLIDSTFSIMGALCKADNVVTRDEIQSVERVFEMLNLRGEQREQAKAAFTRGKQPGFDVDAAADEFARISRGRGPLLQLFLQLQVMAVAADGRVHPAEHAMLVRVATGGAAARGNGRPLGGWSTSDEGPVGRCLRRSRRDIRCQRRGDQARLSQTHEPEPPGQAGCPWLAGEYASRCRGALARDQFRLRPDQISAE